MASTYPSVLDAFSTGHLDNVNEIIHASTIDDLADATNKIEAELGLVPRGTFASVRARLDAIQHIPTATIAVAASNAQQNFITSADFLCDNTDDQVEINAAIASLPAAGGRVLLSEGTFTLSGPVACQKDFVVLAGQGRNTTILVRGGSFVDGGLVSALVQVNRDDLGGTSRRAADACEVRDMTIDGNYLGTQGTTHGLHFKCSRGTVENVQTRFNNARGLVVAGATAAERGTASDWSAFGTRVTNCKSHHNGNGGIWYAAAATDAGIDHCEIWQNAGPGFETGAVVNEVAGCYVWGNFNTAAAVAGNGLLFTAGSGRCNIYGCKLEQNRGGLVIVAGSAFQVVGNVIASNSTVINGASDGNTMPSGWYTTGATNVESDIEIAGSGGAPSSVMIEGNYIDPSVYSTDRSKYAISIVSGAQVRIVGNNIGTGLTGQINIAVGGTNVLTIKDNDGYVTEARGTGTIAGAGTTIAVTFGQTLAFAPSASQFRLTPASDPGAVSTYWVSGISTSGMTINCRPAPAGAVVVGYELDGFRQP